MVLAALAYLQGCGGMEGGVDIIHVQHPTWHSASILFNLGYLLVMPTCLLILPRVTSRSVDARLIATFPIIVTVAVSAFAMSETLQFMHGLGESPRMLPLATASSVAVAIDPLLVATAVAAITSLLIRFTALFRCSRTTKSRAGSFVLSTSGVAAIALAALQWYLIAMRPADVAPLASIASVLFWVATFIVALALAVPVMGRHETISVDRWLVTFAICCAIGFTTLWVIQERLERFVATADVNSPH